MSENEKNSKYLNMSNEISDFKSGNAKEKSVATLKMLGKGLFNTSKFLVTEALPKATEMVVKQNIRNSNEVLKNKSIDAETRAKFEDFNRKSKEALKELEEKKQ